jgi:hypothetical protein
MNEQIAYGLQQYEEALATGMSTSEAKEYAYSQIPGLKDIINTPDRAALGVWGYGIKVINKRVGISTNGDENGGKNASAAYTPPPAAAGKRTPHTLVLYQSGLTNVGKTILAAIDTYGVEVGQVIELGDLYFWLPIIGCSRSAIQNILLERAGNRVMSAAGYSFEQVSNSDRRFSVRVTGIPRDKKADLLARRDELIAARDEHARLIAEVDRLLGK